MKEVDEKIESLMRPGEHMIRKGKSMDSTMITAFVCNVCCKEGSKTHIKKLILREFTLRESPSLASYVGRLSSQENH